MTDNPGVYLLLCITCTPWIAGLIIGYWLRGRVDKFGWVGAFLPGFIRERIG